MNRPVFQIFRRFMHDRKLPSVVPNTTQIKSTLVGSKSPKKADYNNIYNDLYDS